MREKIKRAINKRPCRVNANYYCCCYILLLHRCYYYVRETSTLQRRVQRSSRSRRLRLLAPRTLVTWNKESNAQLCWCSPHVGYLINKHYQHDDTSATKRQRRRPFKADFGAAQFTIPQIRLCDLAEMSS